MADMVQQSLYTKLEQEKPAKTPDRKDTPPNKKDRKYRKGHKSVNKSEEYIKYSWLF